MESVFLQSAVSRSWRGCRRFVERLPSPGVVAGFDQHARLVFERDRQKPRAGAVLAAVLDGRLDGIKPVLDAADSRQSPSVLEQNLRCIKRIRGGR